LFSKDQDQKWVSQLNKLFFAKDEMREIEPSQLFECQPQIIAIAQAAIDAMLQTLKKNVNER